MFAVIAVKLFKAIVRGQAGKTVNGIDLLARECLAHPKPCVELAQGVPGQYVVMHRVGVVLGVRDSTALQQFADEAALHLVILAAHEEAGFGYEDAGGEKSVIDNRRGGGYKHGEDRRDMPFEPQRHGVAAYMPAWRPVSTG